ncbi:MAG: peptidoglycan bridge formation glycyltransferase FemA/FemB family protein [Ignavibacteriales bacterium]|nr:peptidoglycan bridge formation glycyltransferase FemA/FemB family protein [Ignavibacteriota bacterium]MCB9207172.1 peptidoglycan bridge formation glycyltransferase FemA/FemB family protein [Ignavibacteriales bacterium]MCB9210990.1 peptidoglycan bridge formation glycyltransferase FemA/FemB family protein [Ignavibacteriales bacterium]
MIDLKYTAEIDKINETDWNDVIANFNDATTFQTWTYGKLNSKSLSHLVVKFENDIVACVQVRIFKPPLMKIGIAYVNPGPLWIKKGTEININILENAMKFLVEEYSIKRGLYLKVNLEYEKTDPFAEEIIKKCKKLGFTLQTLNKQHPILNFDKPLEDLRKGLDQKWRNQLNAAEKNSIEIVDGYNDFLIDEFAEIFKTMADKKKFAKPEYIDNFVKLFKMLPKNLRPLIVLAKYKNEFIGGGVFSVLGSRGIYLYGATNDLGREYKASYLVQWYIIKWLHEKGFSRYDLSGINKQNNPGTYKFKVGVIKNNGNISQFLDPFVYSHTSINKLFVKAIQKFAKKDF